MTKILTVSVAAYNVEKYLDQTLSSLNDERFMDDIEVLIIDDGSKDHTRDIALKYQSIAPETFKYIAKENGGHGSTINKGIELATGKYFRVVDGDDWVDTEHFAQYIERLKHTDADLVITQCKIIEENSEKFNLPINNLTDGEVYRWEDIDDFAQIGLSTTTIKTCLLKDNRVKITEKCFYVDIEYTIWALYYSKTVMYMELPIYMYRKSNVSQSTSKKNMVKNVDMQETVACNVCKMYAEFLAENKLCKSKNEAIYERVAQIVGSTFRTYLLLEKKSATKKSIIEFEHKIEDISSIIFDSLEKERFVRVMRMGNYMFIPILRVLYRLWVIKY